MKWFSSLSEDTQELVVFACLFAFLGFMLTIYLIASLFQRGLAQP